MSIIADTLRRDLGLPSQDHALPDDEEFLSEPWDAAIGRLHDLQGLRPSARPRHKLVEQFDEASCFLEGNIERGDAEALAEYWCRFPFAAWGERFFDAWLKGDVAFFEDLARVARTLAGVHKSDLIGEDAVEKKVLEAALDLAWRLRRDPSRDEVMEECQRLGIHVGSWRHTLKRCKLDFLKGASRGRPKVKKGACSKK